MERSYPKRYNKPRIDRYLHLIAERFGSVAEDVTLEHELDPGWSELLLVDDASAFPVGLTNDPASTADALDARADVVYVDEEFGVVRFSGPIADRRGDRNSTTSGDAPPSPLPVLLWRAGVEAGVWISISGRPYGAGEYTVMLVRVTGALLERGRELSEGLAKGERIVR